MSARVRHRSGSQQQPEQNRTVEIGGKIYEPDPVWKRLEKYPKWIRDYIHNVNTFVGAEEVQELTFLRDQNRALIRLVGELKAENRKLRNRLAKSEASGP